jgi:hypothetical protein
VRPLSELLDRRQGGGRYQETLDLSGLVSGTYVVRLKTGGHRPDREADGGAVTEPPARRGPTV